MPNVWKYRIVDISTAGHRIGRDLYIKLILPKISRTLFTSGRGLGDESGPDIRWWENIVITPG
jgi:hypothetical protein